MKRLIALIALALLAFAPARADAPPRTKDGFAIAAAPYTFVFPRDHGAHPDYQSEWWYYTGHLRAADGRRFGFELTFFRVGLAPGDPPRKPGESRWRGNELYPAHFAITDESGGRFTHVERFEREALGMGGATPGHLDVHSGTWTLHGSGDFVLHAADGASALDLTLRSPKPPAIHGSGGISKKAPCASCASHYYSMTRLLGNGTLRYNGTPLRVEALAWMDHEYGSDELQTNQAGWDWFAIQLDDDRELMLYNLRQKDGTVTPQSSGSLVARDGSVRHLPLGTFAIERTGTWTSPATHGVYPSGWRVRIPSAGLDLAIAPTVRDQELANTTGGVSYWEGSVTISDAQSGKPRGLGYVELTGYAGAISL